MEKSLLQPQNLLTYILVVLSLILALFVLTIPNEVNTLNEKLTENFQDEDFSKRLQESLLPPGYVKPTSIPSATLTPYHTPSTSIKPSSISKTPTPTKPKVSPTPTLLPEIVASTPEHRDKDRSLFGEIIAEKISEYFFLYEKMPNLYSNKSGKLLSSEFSDEIYFYNGTENRTNAIGLFVPDSSYALSLGDSCVNPQVNEIRLIYSSRFDTLTVCKEATSSEEFIILK